MAERTYYDILEVSNTASADIIHAAYERLLAKFDPASPANAGNAAARMQHDAVRQAYLTLGDADKRAQYDRRLHLRSFTPVSPVRVMEPFWTPAKMLIIGLIMLALGGFYFKYQRDQARIEAEKVIAVAKAKEAEEKARAEAEAERLAYQREQDRERKERMEASRLSYQRDADVSRYQRDARMNEFSSRVNSSFDRGEEARRRAEEARIKREEMQAAAVARQRLNADRAELCRIERERYGRALSC
jgi:curved DNA-binding protein CbpA